MNTPPNNSIERDRSVSSNSLQSTNSLTTLMEGLGDCESEGGRGETQDCREVGGHFLHFLYFKIPADPEHWGQSRESSLLCRSQCSLPCYFSGLAI